MTNQTDDFAGARCTKCGTICRTPNAVVHQLCYIHFLQHDMKACNICTPVPKDNNSND